MWPGVVSLQLEILILEIKEILNIRIQLHHGQRSGLTGELQAGLIQMVQIEMGVAGGMDECAGAQSAHLCHHHAEQGIGGNVERNAEESVGRTLVELERKPSVGHIELEHRMTRRQRHLVHFGYIPCGYNHAARVGIVLNLVEHVLNLVDGAALIVGP